ncbi:hypothetical protein N7457_002949 [Penicillium paradoxum]|uniref:uncharacterized protein n=1 Tax=Penicillium paradoxum TaxID=176176 RepID=UPI0025465891|nr:uncharacterized protein N7457_002949 [Penicillium paradoxum]KAJ5787959.1 hypothetical protein N7457_002949 [Penicillium paradoxum]
MLSTKSLKSDPLGIVDTRLMMAESPEDRLFSPFFSPFTAFDGTVDKQPGRQIEADASSKRAHRILELRESFRGFDSNRKCPRLELDVAVDKYHTLDGLAEPLNPQNTPASNSERESTEGSTMSLGCYKIENMRTSPSSQPEEFNFDCFQDSPDASFVCQDDGTESLKPPTLRRLSLGDRHWIKSPTEKATPEMEGRSSCKSSKRSPCNGSKMAQHLAAHIPKDHNVCVSSLSSLPYRASHQNSFAPRVRSGGDALEMRGGHAMGATVTDDSTTAEHPKYKIPDFLAVSFSLYRIQSAPGSSPEKVPKYAFKFRITQTYLPRHPSPHFPTTLEHIACRPVIDNLMFHACFIIPALVVMIPATVIFITTALLTETRVGAVMVQLGRALLCLMTNVLILILAKCGVSCSCQWNPDTCHSVE